MKKISAEIVADSVNERGNRITSFILTYPRFIHSEVMTHRMFSRNAASSRAIPFEKMVKMVEEDPFIPIAWQKDHKGMQGTEYITDEGVINLKKGVWLKAKDQAIHSAEGLHHNVIKAKSMYDTEELEGTSVTKQLCNRLLEPFQWYTCLVTATEFDNFFELRCPKFVNEHEDGADISFSRKDFINKLKERYPDNWERDLKDFYGIENNTNEEWFSLSKSGAEIHIQALAEAMWDAMNESSPNQLKAGEWHIPFGGKEYSTTNTTILEEIAEELNKSITEYPEDVSLKVSVARAARLSYLTFDGEIDYKKDIKLHDQLLENKHMSPFEHCARAMSLDEIEFFKKASLNIINNVHGQEVTIKENYLGWCDNFKGFISYRHLLGHGKK